MAKRTDLKKILIIGSGPIVIGQAAEFLSMGKATPFEGKTLYGECIYTSYLGKTAYSKSVNN